jgi:hypothetical protein
VNWTCVDLCADRSALAGGKVVELPTSTLDNGNQGPAEE